MHLSKRAKVGSLEKYKKVLTEFIINVISFSLLILVQQIIALPFIARFYNLEEFGEIILLFGISNIIISVFGYSIGSARLLDKSFYNQKYMEYLKLSNILVFFLSFIIFSLIFSNAFIDSILYAIICVLGSIRCFLLSEYRIKDIHKGILRQNCYYFLGMIFGLIVFNVYRNWLIVFLIAEISSIVLSYALFFYKERTFKSFNDQSPLKSTNTVQLGINSAISYTLTQFDRLIIYPVLGATNVSLYYSAEISARVGGLIMNPLSNFLLGKLSNKKDDLNNRIIHLVISASIIVMILYFIVTFFTTPMLINILYPDFLNEIKHIILPICLGAAFMGGVSVLKPVSMKYIGVKSYNKLFTIYGFILTILSILLCINFGLIGIAVARAICNGLLFAYSIISLKTHKNLYNKN